MTEVLAAKPVAGSLSGGDQRARGQHHRAVPIAWRVSACWLIHRHSTKGEVTDKGSINQRRTCTHRAAVVAALHADTLPHVLTPTS